MKIYFYVLGLILFIFLIVKYTYFYHIVFIMNNYFEQYSPRKEYYPTNMRWCRHLRNNYQVIRDEYLDYFNTCGRFKRVRDLDSDQGLLDCTPIPWTVLVLRCFNKDTEKMKLFPKTEALLKKVPGCTLAMFSLLYPGQYLPPHRGIYKGVLRYHLSLIIPKEYEKCYLIVNGKRFSWKEGGDVIFDDRFEHEVHNETEETRVVLFMDIQRRFKNIFLDSLNSIILYLLQYNKTITKIVRNTNSIPKK